MGAQLCSEFAEAHTMSSSRLHPYPEIREVAKAVGNALAHAVAGLTFEVEARTNHTTYKAKRPVEVEILAPPVLFKEPSDQETELITVEGTNVLKSALLLNAKCGSFSERPTTEKRRTDAQDIHFLLRFCASHPEHLPKANEVPRAAKEFVEELIQDFGSPDAWVGAGYNFETGHFDRN
ncbi:uncharacterized protein KD926_004007 [Aspergillus affinis]|uniref:uncharacterized protein n=1 Tax=Aspergillus affinis TaxID=1070780 RepID=UPI0022FE995F|nr:uncharacterized protein KD926_004007 [Aspergillus affinis]KAI9046169.1 hypothetical protein KD926_004007 [Aspergillus affinis]